MISVLYHNYNDKILQSSWLSAVLFLTLNEQCTVIGQSSHSQAIGQYDKLLSLNFFLLATNSQMTVIYCVLILKFPTPETIRGIYSSNGCRYKLLAQQFPGLFEWSSVFYD